MLVAFIVASLAVSCGSNPEIDRQLTKAEEIMEQHPDSAYMLLNGIIVFFTGYRFPRIFSRMIVDYKSEYPDVPEKYVIQICRGKLMKRYSLNIATGCFLASLFICIGKRPPVIVWYLIAIGTISLIAYIRYGQKYKNL